MGNKPHTFPTRADWSHRVLLHLFKNNEKGLIPLNQFAIDVLKISPDNTVSGHEFDAMLQGMEDLHQIVYKASEKNEGGFKRRSLNDVAFSALLQFDGYRLMADRRNNRWMLNLTLLSVLVALAAALASLASVIIQANGKSDIELQGLNSKLKEQVQILQSMQQSQKGIDASLHRIADSLKR